jgi:hypothetical protein
LVRIRNWKPEAGSRKLEARSRNLPINPAGPARFPEE